MKDTTRVYADHPASADAGQVIWQPIKSIWFLSQLLLTVIVAPFYCSWSALSVFLVFTALTLCMGHSLGMHRLLIHRAYECPRWLEYTLVYLGVLVGMAGPIGMLKQHDLRDWAQRQGSCHPFLRHGSRMSLDGWWQLNCDLKLHHPPHFQIEPRVWQSRFYRVLEVTWLLHAALPALPLYLIGGLDWVLWGLSVRVVVSLMGHWLIGYFAHNQGQQTWMVEGAAVQGHNIRLAGLISMGEAWHNNHHAFPGSAMLGLYQDEPDPGWWVLNALHNLGLVKNMKLPTQLPPRTELRLVAESTERMPRVPEPCAVAAFLHRLR